MTALDIHTDSNEGGGDGDRLYDAHAVAEMLAVKVSWVQEHTRLGDIPHIQLGRYCRYDLNEVMAWARSLGTTRSSRERRKHA